MKLGVALGSLRLPVRAGILAAAKIGVTGVQLDCVGDLKPDRLSDTGRRELKHLLRSHGLELTALNCPLRHGLAEVANQDGRLEFVREVMSLSFALGTRTTIVQPGPLAEADSPERQRLTEALLNLGQHGDRIGTVLALETGLDAGDTLANFLATFDTGGLGANYDPANLFVNGHDPYDALTALKSRLTHVHARDARRQTASRTAAEVPLGAGDLDWLRLTATLGVLEYRGWVVVERENATDALAELTAGVSVLRRLLP